MKKKTEQFIKITFNYYKLLGNTDAQVFAYIEGICKSGLKFNRTNDEIGETLGLSTSTVARSISRLKTLNYISVERKAIPIGTRFLSVRIITALPEESHLTK